jgi:hypothetical protein
MPNDARPVNGRILYHGQWYEDEQDLRMALLEERAEANEQRLMFGIMLALSFAFGAFMALV